MKKYIFIFIILISILFISSCKHYNNSTLKGIEEILSYEVPDGYKHEKNDVYSDNDKLISIHYGNGYSSVYFMILSYKGKAVMGSDETLGEWIKDRDNIAETYKIKNSNINIYLYPIGINKNGKIEGEKSLIEGVFEYKNYLIMVGIFNHEGEDITKKQKELFNDFLDSIKLNEF